MSSPAAFIESLRRLGKNDLGKVATLRRSLSSDPGEDVRAFPMVERHLPSDRPWNSDWDRQMYYLVAGLWATVNTASVLATATDEATTTGAETETPAVVTPPTAPQDVALGERGRPQRRSFGWTVAQVYRQRGEIESIEQRFIALLDADDAQQLAHHLRQLVQLARAGEVRIHWVTLLDDLRYWNDDERRVQHRWAREFYRAVNMPNETNDDAAVRSNAEGA